MRQVDLDTVVGLHLDSLTGLLTMLGPQAVGTYYQAALSSEAALNLVDEKEGEIRGFVTGATATDRVRREAARARPLRMMLAVTLAVATRPRLLTYVLGSLSPWSRPAYEWAGAELVYVAVAPGARGKGVGRALVEAFGEALAQREYGAYELSVDAENRAALALYESLGFERVGRYREFGIEHVRLRIDRGERP